ncbi:5-(carboxyamino)imidazole ribonucleotide synthase [Natranaeroarchaeum sulfidigenes]|uniref:N5-carboxyaminoimidazole ribonucleotide synthase n=1 Tax=Natranaeroarchaeum sulfidigenes TaxID=2784880 RepID=A0A897MRL6_9EURY|nr:5-(carboxyamino)imidazole ribonucleotide synthase [Natranaeroarchaeum sulfidigenes]QSG03204.1 Phosphoribosylaminoimidazole carboxylase (NCAIR synthetase) [Natranaeroarchaeum sulfidigenes]
MTPPLSTPGPTLGVVGGGQLGRMLGEAAGPLGIELIVLDPTPECPASPVVRDQIVGEFDDEEAVRELADRSDYLTFEIELADPDLLERLETAADVPVHPSPDTLRTIQDKLVQKDTLTEAGIPVPEYRPVDDAAELRAALDEFGTPAMVKAREGGYDGRGNVPIESPDDAESVLDSIAGPAMVEKFVDFERELSVIGVKGDEEVATFTTGENVHREEILRETIVPARASEDVLERARSVARDVLGLMDGRGVYGIELFETEEGEILVNEIAPRPHNSGHWTIEGAVTSQFEQHVRAVTGRPLGSTEQRDPTVMTNILGDVDETQPAELHGLDEILSTPRAALHWYGKRDVRPLRKMGHLTLTDSGVDPDEPAGSPDQLLARARDLRDAVTFTEG